MDRDGSRDSKTQRKIGIQGDKDRLRELDTPGNTKGGSITVPLTSCLTGLD